MPSSRLEVATTAGSRLALGRGPASAGGARAGAPSLGFGGSFSSLRRQFVQPAAQAFGQPSRVREHDRRLVLFDQVEHPLLDVRPDGTTGGRVLAVLPAPAASRGVQLGHVLDRDDDLQFDALGAGRLHDRDRAGTAEEGGDLLGRAHRGGQADPLGGTDPVPGAPLPRLAPQRVQAFQGQGQVRAALVARDGVHLVHDDRFHPAQGFPRLGREQQEQRLRRRDEDVGRLAGQLPALFRGGVAGADRHPDVWFR